MILRHTVTSFDSELDDLKQLIRSMGALAARQLRAAVEALAGGRRDEAKAIVLRDKAIADMQRQIEAQTVCFIVKHQPLAIDLREAISAIRLASNIERIGDLGANLAKRTVALDPLSDFAETVSDLQRLSETALWMLDTSMDAIARRDSEPLLVAWRARNASPNPYNGAIERLAMAMLTRPASISAGAHLLFCIRNVEHVEAHAEEVGRIVYAAIEGRPLASCADHDARETGITTPPPPAMVGMPFSPQASRHALRDLHGIDQRLER